MNSRQFFNLVAEIRFLRKTCEGIHDIDDMTLLKAKEKALDAEIARVQAIPPEQIEKALKQQETAMMLVKGLDLEPSKEQYDYSHSDPD